MFCNPFTNKKKHSFFVSWQIPAKAYFKMQNLKIRYFEVYALKYIVVIITRVGTEFQKPRV